MLYEDINDGFGVADVVIGIEFEFFKLRVLPHEVFDGIFQRFHDLGEFFFPGRGFDIKDDLVVDSEFLGDRQGIIRRASVVEVVDLNL